VTREIELEPGNVTSDTATPPRLSGSILDWIGRTYKAMEAWKSKAAEVFFASNGDSNLSRNRVASIIRTHFVETILEPETVERWKGGFEEIESVVVTPPKITVSNSTYIDWLYVADYLLLACASPSDVLAEENQRRETEYQSVLTSYRIRLVVHHVRESIRNAGQVSDDDLLVMAKEKYSKASMANIKEARRLESIDAEHELPREPFPAEPMPRYASLYF